MCFEKTTLSYEVSSIMLGNIRAGRTTGRVHTHVLFDLFFSCITVGGVTFCLDLLRPCRSFCLSFRETDAMLRHQQKRSTPARPVAHNKSPYSSSFHATAFPPEVVLLLFSFSSRRDYCVVRHAPCQFCSWESAGVLQPQGVPHPQLNFKRTYCSSHGK